MTDSRSERKVARQIAATAYERELTQELAKLHHEFERWRKGELSPGDLSQRIHAFHTGAARDLFVVYHQLKPSHAIARAVVSGILQRSEVPPELLAALEPAISFYASEPLEANDPDA